MRGSQNSAIALQNTVLSLMIDGYQVEGNNKRFYSFQQANGNPGVAVVHVRVNKIDEEMQELVDQAVQSNNTDKPLI